LVTNFGGWIRITERRRPVIRVVLGLFLILHGLVHLLYAGQSSRLFELQPGMVWPDGSWAISPLLGDAATRLLTSACCVLAAIGFSVGGIGLLARQPWWRPLVVGSAVFFSAVLILLWDGRAHRLADQGAVALLINLAILGALLILHWPDFGF
jgi:hypothetical protein